MIRNLLHEQYEADGDLVLFRCRKCGHVSLSLGSLHAHAEGHRGLFGFQWPWNIGDHDELMELTEVVRVDDAEEITLEEVEGL